ncbi:MAG: ribose-phosphate diphosphokinase [Clostridiales bacterium]|nr:ribose-phosphate diphosphokinase [Clostridiales bacterium]
MAWRKDISIFAGSTGGAFAQRMCEYLNVDLGKSEVIRFSEGNTFVRVLETVRAKDVYLVQPIGLDSNNEFTEILFWMDAFKRASANSVTAIIPYYGYAKGDKKDEPRVSIRGRVCAECIELAGADRIVTMDLHSPQVQGFFKKPVDHLFGAPILTQYVRMLGLDDYVVVAPDAGFTKEARSFAGRLGVPTVLCDKQRTGHDESPEILEVIGDVSGKNCLIVDDFSISGGTLCEVAYQLKDRGAKQILACTSHSLVNEKGLNRIMESPIDTYITTDTVNNDIVLNSDFTQVVSVAPLFAETVRRIHVRESVSVLFDEAPTYVLEKTIRD